MVVATTSIRNSSSVADKIRHLYREIFARDPDPEELRIGLAFIGRPDDQQTPTPWSFGLPLLT